MNRNRFFMWAYITFVVVAAILRMCFEFSVWTPIVVAISISSVFFSAEDFCNRISKYYEEYWVTNQEVIDKVKVEFKNLKKGAQNAEDMVKECRNIGLDLPDTFLNSIRTQVPPTTLEKDILLEEERLLKIRKYAYWIRITSAVLTFLGFFSLFIPLIALEYYKISSLVQEMITVGAFVLILLTQQISDILEDKLRIERRLCNEVIESILEVMREIDGQEEFLNDINCVIKEIRRKKIEDQINNASN